MHEIKPFNARKPTIEKPLTIYIFYTILYLILIENSICFEEFCLSIFTLFSCWATNVEWHIVSGYESQLNIRHLLHEQFILEIHCSTVSIWIFSCSRSPIGGHTKIRDLANDNLSAIKVIDEHASSLRIDHVRLNDKNYKRLPSVTV